VVRLATLVLVAVLAPAAQMPQRSSITVSAAVSLTDALTAIADDYGGHGYGGVRFNFGASNVLARQIVDGAPVDVFISADEAQMDVVAKAGLSRRRLREAVSRSAGAVEDDRAARRARGQRAPRTGGG
jgi:molybdate transport system substrate-binding protein